MDHPNKESTHGKIARLKISPKKCQIFRKELKYMGNAIFLKKGEFL